MRCPFGAPAGSPRVLRVLASLAIVTALGALSSASAETASAAGCNTAAAGSWGNNCTIYEGNVSNMVVAIQSVVGDGCGGLGDRRRLSGRIPRRPSSASRGTTI